MGNRASGCEVDLDSLVESLVTQRLLSDRQRGSIISERVFDRTGILYEIERQKDPRVRARLGQLNTAMSFARRVNWAQSGASRSKKCENGRANHGSWA